MFQMRLGVFVAQIFSSLGQQDVGHLDVATGRGALSLSSSVWTIKNLWHPPEAKLHSGLNISNNHNARQTTSLLIEDNN